jgi:hypothetical protein
MSERDLIRRWAQTWKQATPELEAIRRREVAESDNLHVLALLEDAFNSALETTPLRSSSGLVDLQRLLAKLA